MTVPPTPKRAPTPAQPTNELGAKLEQLMRENRPRALRGKGRIIAALLLLTGVGMLVESFVGGSKAPSGQALRGREEASKARRTHGARSSRPTA